MPNVIPHPDARDDANDHQLSLIIILDEAHYVLQYAALVERAGLLPVADAMRLSAERIRDEARRALAKGEAFHNHHKAMADEIRQLRRKLRQR